MYTVSKCNVAIILRILPVHKLLNIIELFTFLSKLQILLRLSEKKKEQTFMNVRKERQTTPRTRVKIFHSLSSNEVPFRLVKAM